MSMSKPYAPCFRCAKRLNSSKVENTTLIRKEKPYWTKLKEEKNIIVGAHGLEKAALKNIDLTLPEEIALACSGSIIEAQIGKRPGEVKFIFYVVRNKEVLHYIFLKESNSSVPALINVYNPTEGMNFKWSPDGKRRLYLNSFRSCCPHPNDDKENYNKRHHGVQHALYKYQYEDSK